jgi:hypothetical protein
MSAAFCSGTYRVRNRAAHFGRRLVFALTLIDDLPLEIIVGPGEELNLGDELRPYLMHPAQHQRRTEAAAARWRYV